MDPRPWVGGGGGGPITRVDSHKGIRQKIDIASVSIASNNSTKMII